MGPGIAGWASSRGHPARSVSDRAPSPHVDYRPVRFARVVHTLRTVLIGRLSRNFWHERRAEDAGKAYRDFTQAAVITFARMRHFPELVGVRGQQTAPAVSVREMRRHSFSKERVDASCVVLYRGNPCIRRMACLLGGHPGA